MTSYCIISLLIDYSLFKFISVDIFFFVFDGYRFHFKNPFNCQSVVLDYIRSL